MRWWVDFQRGRQRENALADAETLAAESDRSPGVLLGSGYIAGGAIAGIIIAFMAAALGSLDARLTQWAEARNPFYAGSNSDLLAMIPFVALTAYLYWVATRPKSAKSLRGTA